MRIRNRQIHTMLSEDEFNDLMDKVERSGLDRSAFVRKAIAGQEIYEVPNTGVPRLIREVRRVASALEQILLADQFGEEEMQELQKALEANRSVEKKIVKAFHY